MFGKIFGCSVNWTRNKQGNDLIGSGWCQPNSWDLYFNPLDHMRDLYQVYDWLRRRISFTKFISWRKSMLAKSNKLQNKTYHVQSIYNFEHQWRRVCSIYDAMKRIIDQKTILEPSLLLADFKVNSDLSVVQSWHILLRCIKYQCSRSCLSCPSIYVNKYPLHRK